MPNSPAAFGCSLSGKRSTATFTPLAVALVALRKTLLQSRNSTFRSHLAIRRMATLTSSMACSSWSRKLSMEEA